ncbi:MAG: hypothetical protein P9L92_14850 [Candidatus Electryonea clarkiae]|nr:hypothetical protein [Candidatus Electryonea clarkiae]MDP8286229.1 hypothetical protein [Candidatus Electryonea clarkiae]
MKKILTLVLFFAFVSAGFAQQPKYAWWGGSNTNGWQVGPIIKVGEINRQMGVFSGAKASLLVNRYFAVGGQACFTTSDTKYSSGNNPDPIEYDLKLDYIGGEFEIIINPIAKMHSSINLFAGGGRVRIIDTGNTYESTNIGVFVGEPGVGVEWNITNWLRSGLVFSYRLVSNFESHGLDEVDLSDASVTIGLKIGKFQ